MPFEIMNEIVKRKTLGIEEVNLLRLLISWEREQKLNNSGDLVKQQVKELAKHLKLNLIHPEAFFSSLKPTGWFSTDLLWDTLHEMVNANRNFGHHRENEDDPKYIPRKPGPLRLKPKKRNVPENANPSYHVALLGSAASGKTTALYKWKLGEVVTTIPSKLRQINYHI